MVIIHAGANEISSKENTSENLNLISTIKGNDTKGKIEPDYYVLFIEKIKRLKKAWNFANFAKNLLIW